MNTVLSSSFQKRLTLFSQIPKIMDTLKESKEEFHAEILALSEKISTLCEENFTNDATTKKITFICNQLKVCAKPGKHQGKQYESYLISEAANLYLRNRNSYRALRTILTLPNEKTLRSFFGKFGTAGDEAECVQAINDVINSLSSNKKKIVFISADEIYVKPAIRFRGGHVIGFA